MNIYVKLLAAEIHRIAFDASDMVMDDKKANEEADKIYDEFIQSFVDSEKEWAELIKKELRTKNRLKHKIKMLKSELLDARAHAEHLQNVIDGLGNSVIDLQKEVP